MRMTKISVMYLDSAFLLQSKFHRTENWRPNRHRESSQKAQMGDSWSILSPLPFRFEPTVKIFIHIEKD